MEIAGKTPAERIVSCMNRVYRQGLTTSSGGNISVVDDAGQMWITPAGLDKGKLLPEQIPHRSVTGVWEGSNSSLQPSTEHPIHSLVYATRPEFRAVLHAHCSALVAFSAARRLPTVGMLPYATALCESIGYAPYKCPGSEEFAQAVADTFAQGHTCVLLENHGVIIAGQTLLECFKRIEVLELCAQVHLLSKSLGVAPVALKPSELLQQQLARHPLIRASGAVPTPTRMMVVKEEEVAAARQQLVEVARRCYTQQLVGTSSGTFSVRLAERTFLVTPLDVDFCTIQEHELLVVQADEKPEHGCQGTILGTAAKGSIPTPTPVLIQKAVGVDVPAHLGIYRRNPAVSVVITAAPRHATALAASQQHFDSRVIPECYIVLQHVRSVPYLTTMDPQALASQVDDSHPTALLWNAGVLVTGPNFRVAFDRLEVLDALSRVVVYAHQLGGVQPMTDESIRVIEHKFLKRKRDDEGDSKPGTC